MSNRRSQADARHFKDSVHDYVSFSPWICTFIDTKHFQRLRYLKQLGLTYYVFPGAAHNRFEHGLGTGYLARLMVAHLRDMDDTLGITDQHIQCVELAGLCHDLGHGPFSHFWDGVFVPAALPGSKWTHEQASEMMFDDMVETYQLRISPEEVALVKALISGDTGRDPLGKKMPFLFEIVSNKRNGLDVDKLDYILRDCHAVGDKGNISITKLIHSARVIDGQICYNIKDANQIYELFYTRFSLHKRVYNHKTTRAIEYMLMDALLQAEPHLKFVKAINDPKRYVCLTDHLLNKVEESMEEELEPARAIIERIRSRDLYRLVDYKVFSHMDEKMIKENVTPEAIVAVAKSGELPGVDEELVAQIQPSHMVVTCSLLHYGQREKNPLDEVTFYAKGRSQESRKADPSDVSLSMPQYFSEVWLRIYTKDGAFHGLIQAAYRHILGQLVSADPSIQAVAKEEGHEEEDGDGDGDGFDHGVWSGVKITTTDADDNDDIDLPPVLPFRPPPVGDGPVTPRRSGRYFSTPAGSGLGLGAPGTRGRTGRTASFTENKFTAVAPNFRGESPTRQPSKRGRDADGERPGKAVKLCEEGRHR